MSGKGSKRRPCQISKHEEDLRWKLAFGYISFEEFERRMHEIKQKENKGTT